MTTQSEYEMPHEEPRVFDESVDYGCIGQIDDTQDPTKLEQLKGFVHRNRVKLAVSATVGSVLATVAIDPMSETIENVKEAAPWVVGGVATSEALFVTGAIMMAASVGRKVGNPFKIKERIPEIASKADSSRLFKTGFWVNTIGAVGDFVAVSPAIVSTMPVHSWGVLGFTLADLGVTYGVRRTIWRGVKENASQE